MSVSFQAATLSPPRRLLVRGVNWLGDAVMTTPALMRLREALPNTHIALLTRAKLADLWKSHPAINEVITIEPGESVWAVGGKLRAGSYDAALVLPNSPRSALEVWLAGIPNRVGYARPWRNWFLTKVVPTRSGHLKMHKRGVAEIKQLIASTGEATIQDNTGRKPVPQNAHQMHEYLQLAGVLGACAEPVAPTLGMEVVEIETTFSKLGISREGVWLGLNAGAEYGPAKRWPKENFIAAAKAIQQRTGCGVLVLGGPGDVALAEEIVAQLCIPQSTVHNVAGRTSLRELMALLTQCRALLTNDTGPMHVAAALNVPVVVPFGSTSPELTGPGQPGDSKHRLIKSDAPCAPCFLRECPIDFRCMNGISVERMVNAVMEIIERPQS